MKFKSFVQQIHLSHNKYRELYIKQDQIKDPFMLSVIFIAIRAELSKSLGMPAYNYGPDMITALCVKSESSGAMHECCGVGRRYRGGR